MNRYSPDKIYLKKASFRETITRLFGIGQCSAPLKLPKWASVGGGKSSHPSGIFFLGRAPYPLRTPKFVDVIDLNDPKPGDKGFFKASGIFLVGRSEENEQIWLNANDVKTHMLVYGTTGSGKSVFLQGLAENAIFWGSGLTYIDPKGDTKLIHELYLSARRFSREDDVLALDFMHGAKRAWRKTPFKMSNTINPFAAASADGILNILLSLFPEDSGGNTAFQQKAIALLKTLVPVLAALRDAGVSLPLTDMSDIPGCHAEKGSIGKGLSISTILDYLDPTLCVSLAWPLRGENPDKKIEECDEVAKIVDDELLARLKATLCALNYTPGKDIPKKQQVFLEQFGYAKGYFGSFLSAVSGMYGHLFNVSSGEIDMWDVLFNRRILIGCLPASEKSPQECETLGRIILSAVKNGVTEGLTERLRTANTDTILGARPSSAEFPALIIVDEYPAIMLPGFEVILTQCRSLGFGVIIASQDYDGMLGRAPKSCRQIEMNTITKIFMKAASRSIWEHFKKYCGLKNVEEIHLNDPEKRGHMRRVSKVSNYDLMTQCEGEFHLVHRGNIYKGEGYYLVEPATQNAHVRLNRFVRIRNDREYIRENIAAWLAAEAENPEAKD